MGTHATITAIAAAALTLPASAAAQTPASLGGVSASPPPAVAAVGCQAACRGLQRATAGATIRVTGTSLTGATTVVFLGRRGRRDDVFARTTTTSETSAEAIVPARARTGPVRVIGADGQPSKATTRRLILGPGALRGAPMLQAKVDARTVFLDGQTKPTLTFFVGGRSPSQLRVDLLRDGVGDPVATWSPGPLPGGSVQTIAWDGALAPVPPPEGRYTFRVTVTGGAAARVATSRPSARPGSVPTATSGFVLLAHAFPIRGPHEIGRGPAQIFGAGRTGHTHQGQDIFAACGTPLVAVSSGVIRYRAFQSAAGNYLVLRADGDGTDYAYMHLRDPALVGRGARVTTGQLLGYVGDTGDAQGCHLHFEKWPAPGWYTGGAPVDPLADLQTWDTPS